MATRTMSSEDFRAHLYHSLQGKGILDSLKSQLRNRLATELHKTLSGSGSSIGSSPAKSPHKSMREQVADSIMAEYLKATGYEYSLSIFLPEAGTSMDKLFSEDDILQFLRIPPSSDMYKHLKSPAPHNNSPGTFMGRLLEALIESQARGTAVQTSSVQEGTPPPGQVSSRSPASHTSSPPKKSVADKLEELDVAYARKAEEETVKCQASLEDRLLTLQRDLEARYKHQLESELTLYRNKEITKVRQEERDRHREELAKEKESLHHLHQLKLEEVKKSEQCMMEKYRRKEQELESGVYSQRQTLLEELNALRVKEAGLRREVELDRRAVALEKEQVRAKTEQLEANMKQTKAHLELMAEEKLQKAKAGYEQELQSKRDELEQWEARLRTDGDNVDPLRLDNKKLATELSEQRMLVEKLQAQLHEATWSESGAHKLKLAEETQLKRQVAELKQQLSLVESKHSELKASHKQQQLTIKQQQAQLTQPNPEHISLQVELEQLRKTHHKQMLVLEYDNKQLGRQLAAQSNHTLLLQKRLDDQLLELRSAQREVQDLHSQLEHGGQALHGSQGSRGSLGRSMSSPAGKSFRSSKLSSTQQPTHSSSKPTTPLPPPSHMAALFQDDLTSTVSPTTPNQKKRPSVSFFDSSGAFLAESRATIERMEKEAQQLDKTYRNFTYHMVNSTLQETGMGHAPLATPSPVPGLQAVLSPYSGQSAVGITSISPLSGPHYHHQQLLPTGIHRSGSSGDTSPTVSPLLTPTSLPPHHVTANDTSILSPVTIAPPPASSVQSVPFSQVYTNPPANTHTPSPTGSPIHSAVSAPSNPISLDNIQTPPPVGSLIVNSAPAAVSTLSNPVSPGMMAVANSTGAQLAGTQSFSKPVTSLDSWWKAPEPTSAESVALESMRTPSVQSRAETRGVVVTPPSPTLPETLPTTSTLSPANTVLTGATQTPILSVVPMTITGRHDYRKEEESVGKVESEDMGAKSSSAPLGYTGDPTVLDVASRGNGGALTVAHSDVQSRPEGATDAGSASEDKMVTGKGSEGEGHRKGSEGEEDEIDSVMLKYMQLVKEKRQQETQHPSSEPEEKSGTQREFDVPPLSEDVSRFDGLSDQGDDPFEDW